jgi:hypothetical protein
MLQRELVAAGMLARRWDTLDDPRLLPRDLAAAAVATAALVAPPPPELPTAKRGATGRQAAAEAQACAAVEALCPALTNAYCAQWAELEELRARCAAWLSRVPQLDEHTLLVAAGGSAAPPLASSSPCPTPTTRAAQLLLLPAELPAFLRALDAHALAVLDNADAQLAALREDAAVLAARWGEAAGGNDGGTATIEACGLWLASAAGQAALAACGGLPAAAAPPMPAARAG